MKYLITCFTFLIYFTANAQEDYIDKLELASLLLKNDNIQKAASVLDGIKNPNDVQTDYYYILMGLIQTKKKNYSQACLYFEKALLSEVQKEKKPEFLESYATALLKNGDFEKANSLLNENKQILNQRVKYFQLLAEYNFSINKHETGWNILNKAAIDFPKDINVKKQIWYYLYTHNLLEASKRYLLNSIIPNHRLTARDYALYAYQYRQKNAISFATQMGEAALLINPFDIDSTKELARIYIGQNNFTAAASLFEKLSLQENSYLLEASELWRKAKIYSHSNRLALKIDNPEQRLKQKILVALEQKKFTDIKALSPFIERSALKENADIMYTLAYSHFILADYAKAEAYLLQVQRDDLLDKSITLREAISNCAKKSGVCL